MSVAMAVVRDGGDTALVFSGRLDAAGAGKLWRPAIRAASRARGQGLRLDLAAVEAVDMSGAALLLAVEHAHGAAEKGTPPKGTSLGGMQVTLTGASEHASAVLTHARRAATEAS